MTKRIEFNDFSSFDFFDRQRMKKSMLLRVKNVYSRAEKNLFFVCKQTRNHKPTAAYFFPQKEIYMCVKILEE
jgi:hypothetical protein